MNFNFLKNINNTKANPAKEETLVSIKNDTASIISKTATLIAGTADTITSTDTLKTSTANILPVKRANMANSKPITIASDQTVKVIGNMSFDTSRTMSATDDDSLFYLRKMVKQLEPLSTTDASKRQRVWVDGSSSDMALATTTVFNTLAGFDQRRNQYIARSAFADGIRSKLSFN